MVFSSLLFTFVFLPAVLFFYYISKERYRNYILLAASLFFYAYGEPKFVFIMLLSILMNYLTALGIDHGRKKESRGLMRTFLILAVSGNLLILFLFKYLDFSISILDRIFGLSIPLKGLVLPIGISFFTFQALSYVVDVYRGN